MVVVKLFIESVYCFRPKKLFAVESTWAEAYCTEVLQIPNERIDLAHALPWRLPIPFFNFAVFGTDRLTQFLICQVKFRELLTDLKNICQRLKFHVIKFYICNDASAY